VVETKEEGSGAASRSSDDISARLPARPSVGQSVDLRLVARTALDTLQLELLLDVIGNTALHGDRIHPAARTRIYPTSRINSSAQKGGVFFFFVRSIAPPSSSSDQQRSRCTRQSASSYKPECDLTGLSP
jgi:hypothetical protein